MTVIVAYDIPLDRRRTRLAKALKNFGDRIQYSVFECDLNARQYEAMKRAVVRIVDEQEDRVHFFLLCGTCHARRESMPANLGTLRRGAVLI